MGSSADKGHSRPSQALRVSSPPTFSGALQGNYHINSFQNMWRQRGDLYEEGQDHSQDKLIPFACRVPGVTPEPGPGWEAWEEMDQRQGPGASWKTRKALKTTFS